MLRDYASSYIRFCKPIFFTENPDATWPDFGCYKPGIQCWKTTMVFKHYWNILLLFHRLIGRFCGRMIISFSHNFERILGRGSIVHAIFVNGSAASLFGGYIAALEQVFVKSTNRRVCLAHQLLDPASSSLSALERYLRRYLYSKWYLIVTYSQFCLGCYCQDSWSLMMILIVVATRASIPQLAK